LGYPRAKYDLAPWLASSVLACSLESVFDTTLFQNKSTFWMEWPWALWCAQICRINSVTHSSQQLDGRPGGNRKDFPSLESPNLWSQSCQGPPLPSGVPQTFQWSEWYQQNQSWTTLVIFFPEVVPPNTHDGMPRILLKVSIWNIKKLITYIYTENRICQPPKKKYKSGKNSASAPSVYGKDKQ